MTDVYEIFDQLLEKYLKPNKQLEPHERDIRNHLISKVSGWNYKVEDYLKENLEADVKDYNDRIGRL